jgi:hypothetical protein
MLKFGDRNISTAFIKHIELDNEFVVITFYLGHALKVDYETAENAKSEYRKLVAKFERTKERMFNNY